MVMKQAMLVKVRKQAARPLTMSVRFQVNHGHGLLSRLNGRNDPPPGPIGDADDVDAKELRGGRFVHIGKNGRRLGYSFARLTADRLACVPDDRWIDLVPLTEYGIRYLVLPDDLPEVAPVPSLAEASHESATPEAPHRLAVPTEVPVRREHSPPAAAAVRSGPPLTRTTGRAAPTRTVSPQGPSSPRFPVRPESNAAPVGRGSFGGPKAPPRVERGRDRVDEAAPTNHDSRGRLPGKGTVPVSPNLAEAALRGLSREAAVDQLRTEMTKVADLWSLVRDLEGKLRASQQREADLMDLLTRWQQRSQD